MGAIDLIPLSPGTLLRVEASGGTTTLLDLIALGGAPNSDLNVRMKPQGTGQVIFDLLGATARFRMNGADVMTLISGGVSIAASLNAGGSLVVGGALGVSGAATITGDILALGQLYLYNTLRCTIDNTIDIGENGAYRPRDLWLGRNAAIGGTLAVTGNVGFYGHAVAAQAAAYTPTNVTPDRSYDANATTLDEVADVLGTLIADLQSYGLLQ